MPRSQQSISLVRRSVRHGRFAPAPTRSPNSKEVERLWNADEPIHLPGALTDGFDARVRRGVAATRRLWTSVHEGGGLRAFVARRLKGDARYRLGSASVELFDPCEIEKVFADALDSRGRIRVRDLYAKLSWIADDDSDGSLRIRCSFGSELLGEWVRDARKARAADRFAAAVFPECAALADNKRITAMLKTSLGRTARLSERIIYGNAPGGGAEFHHDAEPGQRAVLYGQFAGETAWLALPKRRLARALAEYGARGRLGSRLSSASRALKALDDSDDAALKRLLNATPAFTRMLADAGALIRLRAGDALMLPSAGPDDCCWHAVFALGDTSSVAHSYGVFEA